MHNAADRFSASTMAHLLAAHSRAKPGTSKIYISMCKGFSILIFVLCICMMSGISSCTLKRSAQIEIKAYYMRYACGDDNIDMKVQWVNDTTYNYLIETDVAPETKAFNQNKLIDWVDSKTSAYLQGKEKYLNNFTLVGRVVNSSGGCDGSATCFRVDSIKYNSEDQFTYFN